MDNENLQREDGKTSKLKFFCHNIDLERLKLETGKTIEDLAVIANLKNPRCIYAWAKSGYENGTRPSYNALASLLKAGASVETLFGVEYSPSRAGESAMRADDLKSLVLKALQELGYGDSASAQSPERSSIGKGL